MVYINNKNKNFIGALAIALIFLGSDSFAVAPSEFDAPITGDTNLSLSSTYSTGIWEADLSGEIARLTNTVDCLGCTLYQRYSKVIESYFIPQNVHLVMLSPASWRFNANTIAKDIPFDSSLDVWLKASEDYGIANIFYTGKQWGEFQGTRSWDEDVYNQFPDMQTVNASGYAIKPTDDPLLVCGKKNCAWHSIDDPRVLYQYKEDLKQLYDQYGKYSSWIGIGTVYGDYANYADRQDVTRKYGFDTSTIKNFVSSPYFLRTITTPGLHADGSEDKLYKMFYDTDSIKLSSGDWQDSDPVDIYDGTGANARVVAFKFIPSENLDGFRIIWYGLKVGSPTDLTIELYRNDGAYDAIEPYGTDRPANLGTPIELVVQANSSITTTATWQQPVTFSSKLAKGDSYWLVFQTSGGDANNEYRVYRRDYKSDESTARISERGYDGLRQWWGQSGSAILKLQDINGIDKKIYPYQKSVGASVNKPGAVGQTFTADRDITFNTVWIHIADRFYDETASVLKVVRTSDNAVLAQGSLDQALLKGLYWWVPIKLNSRVTINSGQEYRIVLEGTSGIAWLWHYLTTDPVSEGFQGQSRTQLFKLADMDIILDNFNHPVEHNAFGVEGGEGNLGISDRYQIAIRYKPSYDGPFTSFAIKIARVDGSPSDLIISLHSGNASQPIGSSLESKAIPVSQISSGSWVTTASWTYSMSAGNYYWIVFSSPGSINGNYRPERAASAYQHLWVWSDDRGSTWKGQGIIRDVGDLLSRATTANEIFAVEPDRVLRGTEVTINDAKWTAQSFSIPTDTSLKGVIVWVPKYEGDRGSSLITEIRTDSGSDTPSSIILASQKTKYDKMGGLGLQVVDFDVPVSLSANTKYWFVFRSVQNADIRLPIYIYKTPSESYGGTNYHAKRSTDRGMTWNLVNEGDVMFALVNSGTPVYSTPELYDDIAIYHNSGYFIARQEPLRGWNNYLNLQTSKILKELTEWFTGYTGKKKIASDVNPSLLIRQNDEKIEYLSSLNYYTTLTPTSPVPENFWIDATRQILTSREASVLKTPGSASVYSYFSWGRGTENPQNSGMVTAEQIGIYYRTLLPLLARGVYIFDTGGSQLGMDNLTQQQWSRFYGDVLRRMRYFGGWFGSESNQAPKVLLIGDRDVGIVPQFLTPALNVTFLGFEEMDKPSADYNLTRFGDFSQFDVIFWFSGRPDTNQITVDAQNRIRNFIQNGGGFVTLAGIPSWLSVSPATVSTTHSIWRPYTNADFVDSRPSISEFALGNGRGLSITLKRSIGKTGTDPNVFGAPKDSILVIINNAVFYAAKKESMLPVWWYKDYRDSQPWNSETYYSIAGKPGNVLVWLSNNLDTESPFEMHLSASFYGIDSNGWIIWDAASGEVISTGTGNDINISLNIPAKSWKPLYIFNSSDAYSNVFITAKTTTLNQRNFSLKGPYKQPRWLLYQSLNRPTSIRINTNPLAAVSQVSDLMSNNGWYYDAISKVVYVRYVEP